MVPRRVAGQLRRKSSPVGHSPVTRLATTLRCSGLSMFLMISAMAKRPIPSGTKPMPSISSVVPKVMRWAPVTVSVPTMLSTRPATIMANALSSDPWARTMAAMRPSMASQKYSAGPKRRATELRGAARRTMNSVATQPAKREARAATASAAPARPCCASL